MLTIRAGPVLTQATHSSMTRAGGLLRRSRMLQRVHIITVTYAQLGTNNMRFCAHLACQHAAFSDTGMNYARTH